MSWDDLTVVELKKILVDEGVSFSSADCRKKSQVIRLCERNLNRAQLLRALQRFEKLPEDLEAELSTNEDAHLDSLAASQLARERFLESQRSHRQSTALDHPTDNRRSLSAKRRPTSVVRAAGRFSVPSDDGISPDRGNVRTSSSAVVTKTYQPTSSTSSYWPAVDPEGQPIRWQIRDPASQFPSNQQMSPQRAEKDHRSSGESEQESPSKRVKIKQKPIDRGVVKYRWGRIFSLVVVIISTLLVVWRSVQPESSPPRSKSFFNVLLQSVVGPPFCDSDKVGDQVDCVRCPDNAICREGKMECRKPQFRKQWRRGTVSCVKDNETYRIAYYLFGSLADFLAKQRGLHSCYGGGVHPEGVPLSISSNGDAVAFSRCSLTNILFDKQVKSTPNYEAALQLLFEELIHNSEDQTRYGIRTTTLPSAGVVPLSVPSCPDQNNTRLTTLFYSVLEKKTLSCVMFQTVKSHLLSICATLLFLIAFSCMFRRWRFRRTAEVAIRQIIMDRTSIQTVHSLGPHNGYAVGPRAHDIIGILNSSIKPTKWFGLAKSDKASSSEYAQYGWISQYLTEAAVEKICNQLVRSDPSFCRGVLAVDMTPFYFSKRIVDNLRLSSSCSSDAQRGDTYI